MSTVSTFTSSPFAMSPAEAAAYANARLVGESAAAAVTVRMVMDLRRAGTLKGPKVGRSVLISRASIDAWLDGLIKAGSTS